ncbi:zinc-binding dehydrogenase [Demequina litorisediminis]|uniref:Zinc-binding dehydrogenase n=1 Tax=Demequina litorisediminis TaxID=1849022 RepID=A0ABQ6IAS6_9MICO|nr:hypothetical protein GCM10025876_06590 [Demequina litorisediminis]
MLDPLGGENLMASVRVVKPGGTVVGISGPPTPAFAKAAGLNPVVRLATRVLSRRVRALAKARGVSYEFLLMRASGDRLREIATLVDSGAIRPVVGAAVPFERAAQALESLSASGVRGKTVVMGARAQG